MRGFYKNGHTPRGMDAEELESLGLSSWTDQIDTVPVAHI